jgi:cation transporter-like permease
MVSKLQLVIWPVTSLLQNSPALASGAVIAANAIAATNIAAGAANVVKRSLIILPLFFPVVGSFEVLLSLGAEMGWE